MFSFVTDFVAWSRRGSFLISFEGGKCKTCQNTGLDTCTPDVNVASAQLSDNIGRYVSTSETQFRLSRICNNDCDLNFAKYCSWSFNCLEYFRLSQFTVTVNIAYFHLQLVIIIQLCVLSRKVNRKFLPEKHDILYLDCGNCQT